MSAPDGRPWFLGDEPPGSVPGDFPGKDILCGASPLEVLHRLLEGDPLRIHEGALRRVLERCLLLDHATVSKRAFARIARAGPLYRGDPPLAAWLRERYDHSIRELLNEDVEDEHRAIPVDRKQPRIRLLTRNFGIEPGRARRACIRFNGLPPSARNAFFSVHLEGHTPLEYASSLDLPYDRVLGELERALEALSGPREALDQDLPDFSDPTW